MNTNWWNRLRYTLYVPFYDPVVKAVSAGRRRAVELLDVKPGERVLIDACGTGLDLELVPRDAVVTAIDITPAMVERTLRRAEALGMKVDARVGDAAALPFPDGSFDAVLLHLVLAVVPDPCGTAREAARVLRPGGRASIFDKFLPDDGKASIFRKAANLVVGTVATEINRRLGPILRDSGLVLVREEPSIFGGIFRVAIVKKE